MVARSPDSRWWPGIRSSAYARRPRTAAAQVVPDRKQALAAAVDIRKTYEREGFGPAMTKFIALTSLKGPIPADFADQPPPNPTDYGLATADDGSRADPMFGRKHQRHYALRARLRGTGAASTRIVIGAGAESRRRDGPPRATAIAEEIGREAVIFP